MDRTQTAIETAIRYACKDDDGRLYAPVTADHARPFVYVPGYGIHAGGEEIHLISYYPQSGDVEVLAGNGYTLTDGPLVDMLKSAINS